MKEFIKTGIDSLDKKVLFEKGNFLVIGSRPLHAKSSLAIAIAVHNALIDKKRVAIYSTDAKKSHTKKVIDCMHGEISLSNYLKDDLLPLNEMQQKKCDEVYEAIKDNYLYIDDSFYSIETLANKIQEDVNRFNFDLVIIDTLQLINTTSVLKERYLPVNEVSRTLKNLARKINIGLIGVSTLNKAVDTRDYPEPFLRDLKDVGSLEDEADIVLLTSIPEIYVKEQEYQKRERALKYKSDEPLELYKFEPITEVLIRIAKHKGFPFCDVKLDFKKECTKFLEKEKNVNPFANHIG